MKYFGLFRQQVVAINIGTESFTGIDPIQRTQSNIAMAQAVEEFRKESAAFGGGPADRLRGSADPSTARVSSQEVVLGVAKGLQRQGQLIERAFLDKFPTREDDVKKALAVGMRRFVDQVRTAFPEEGEDLVSLLAPNPEPQPPRPKPVLRLVVSDRSPSGAT